MIVVLDFSADRVIVAGIFFTGVKKALINSLARNNGLLLPSSADYYHYAESDLQALYILNRVVASH